MLFSENINLFNHSAQIRNRQTDRQTGLLKCIAW